MEQADLWAPALERHLKGFDRHMPVVHGADGPSHDKPGEQIQDRREIELPATADDELSCVADPPLIRCGRLKVSVQEIGSRRLIVITHRRALVPLAEPRLQPVFLHQAHDPFAADVLLLLEDVSVNLETLGEQKSVIDHLTEKLARIDFTMQEAQNTLQTLTHERELAERIEQSIKQLRTRTAKAEIPRKSATA